MKEDPALGVFYNDRIDLYVVTCEGMPYLVLDADRVESFDDMYWELTAKSSDVEEKLRRIGDSSAGWRRI